MMRLLAGVVACALGLTAAVHLSAQSEGPRFRITSPLGRTGLPGTIRIVARLDGEQPPQGSPSPRVSFYVDKLHLADDVDGPPFEALWNDDNPFERREITARAEFESGPTLTDTVVLNPMLVTEAVEVTSVAIEASVLDEKGRIVRNLTSADFELEENAVRQDLDVVSQRREAGLFTLLIDSSQSMAVRADVVRDAARRFLAPLNPDDAIVVAPFSRGINSVTGPTTDHATVLEAIAAIKPTGGTAILDALQQAVEGTTGPQQRRAVVLITDGYDEHSTVEFEKTVAVLKERTVTVYVIGIGGVAGISLRGERLLTQLAEQTGGRAWFPRDNRRLVEAYATAAEDVQQKYLLTYTPANQRRDGSYRQITVRTRTPGLRVRTREGYTAPMAPPVRTSLEFTAIGSGQLPATLTRDDFEVFEDGVPQKADTFHEAVLPVTFMLALDSSGSMRRSAARAQEAAREFVGALRPEDEVGMIMFANEANYIHSPTTRRDYSLNAIDAYVAEGGTALYDAVYDSLTQLGTVKGGRRVVVVVTDGMDENAASNGPGSLHTWDEVLGKLQQTEATIYAVGTGTRVDRARLQQLADRSGGAAYFPEDIAGLASDYRKILDELRRRYVVGYESSNLQRNGQWRKVDLRAKGGGVVFRSRGGYFAPSQ